MAEAEGEPGNGGEHAEIAEGAHGGADFLVLGEVGEIFEEPEAGEGEADGFALPEEIDGAQERDEEFAKGSTEDHGGVAEPTEEEMAAFVDDQINVVGE